MGATNVEMIVDANGKKEVKEAFNRECDYQREYYGHAEGYSGCLADLGGFRWGPWPMESVKEARKYILNTAQKWETGIAMQVYCYKGKEGAKPPPATVQKFERMEEEAGALRKAIKEEEESIKRAFMAPFTANRNAEKSVKCTACKSTIRYRYASDTCPVCKSSMVKLTSKKLAANRKKLEGLSKRMKEHPQLFKTIISGWVAC